MYIFIAKIKCFPQYFVMVKISPPNKNVTFPMFPQIDKALAQGLQLIQKCFR